MLLAYEKIKDLERLGNYYIGRKDSNIDTKLAQFLNTYPEKEKLRIMFLRESEGVYIFGTKRVYIKVEKGNRVVVRIGGGFISIDDFINQYT